MWGLSTSDLQAIKEVIISILPPKFFKSFCFRILWKKNYSQDDKGESFSGSISGWKLNGSIAKC